MQEARAFLDQNKPDVAIDKFHEAMSADPNHLESRIELAQLLVSRYRFKESHRPIDEALQIDPANLEGLALKGANLVVLRKYDIAAEILQGDLEKNPKHLI